MTTRDRIVLMGIAVLVVLAGGWLLLVAPERRQAAQLESQVSSARQQLESARAQASDARSAEARYTAAYASVVSLGKAVPPSQEVPSLIYELDHASHQRDVNFNSISSGIAGGGPAAGGSAAASTASAAASAAIMPAAFTQMPFTFVFKGSFFGLSHLLGQVDGFAQRSTPGALLVNGRLLTIQGVELTAENKNTSEVQSSSGPKSSGESQAGQISATITATAYVLPASQGLTAGATPAGPAGSSPAQSASSTGSSGSPTSTAVIRVTP